MAKGVLWFSIVFLQDEAVFVINLGWGIVVTLTGTTMGIPAVIQEVVVEADQVDIQAFQVEAGVPLAEVAVTCPVLTNHSTPTEVKTLVEEGVTHSRMAPGTIWDHSSTI